ncbi:MAG: hypothetical protein KDD45_15085 [Bdellovibrionales bacterium]|nr:hypothetical protein [Bdellovibrionales bacterium]
MKILWFFLIVLVVYSAPEADKVMSLKDYYAFNEEFNMYSGYLPLQQSPAISAYYVFA